MTNESLHSKQIIWHWSFWTECWSLVTRQIFEHVLDPRWRFVYSYFYTAILHLFQTFIFRRKLLNLLKELWELFYHSFIFFDEQVLTFTRYKIFRLCMYYSIDFILILPMHTVPMSICHNQDSWFVYATKTDSPLKYSQLRKQCILWDKCDFFAFDRNM